MLSQQSGGLGGGGYIPVFVVWVWLCVRVLTTHELFGNTHTGLQGNKHVVKKCYCPLFTMMHWKLLGGRNESKQNI